MANYENIKDKGFDKRTTNELREISSKGGQRSGEVRRARADFRRTLNLLLTAKIDSPEWTPTLEALGLDSALESAMLAAQIKAAMRGDTKAAYFVAQYAGQSGQTDADLQEQMAKVDLMRAQQQKAEADARHKEPTPEEMELPDPHDLVIPSLWELYDDDEHEHQIVTSGRAGTKSSFAAILAIDTICREEPAAVVVLRKRHNKIRKTVYKEMIRAITRMGLKKSDFDIGITPMEIRCRRTGNVIYFSGSDSIDDTKGIIDENKPIKLVVLDELTEFFDAGEGEEELTNIEATFVRGNDEGFRMLYLYNPPKNPNAPINVWCRKMELRSDAVHVHVDYREVPVSWIGRMLIESAEQLMAIDLKQYRWVWLGEQTGIDETIYYMFQSEHVEEPPKGQYIIGIGGDYGQQNATTFQAFGLDIGKKKLRGLGEYYHSGRESGHQKSPSEYAEEFKAFAEDINKRYGNGIIYLYLDPSAKGLAEEIKRKCPFVRIRDVDNDVALGISRVQKVLTYDVMMVSRAQENAIREFGVYMYDKDSIDKGKEVPVKIDDHCMDAIRYAVMGLWTKLKYFLPEGARGEKE